MFIKPPSYELLPEGPLLFYAPNPSQGICTAQQPRYNWGPRIYCSADNFLIFIKHIFFSSPDNVPTQYPTVASAIFDSLLNHYNTDLLQVYYYFVSFTHINEWKNNSVIVEQIKKISERVFNPYVNSVIIIFTVRDLIASSILHYNSAIFRTTGLLFPPLKIL